MQLSALRSSGILLLLGCASRAWSHYPATVPGTAASFDRPWVVVLCLLAGAGYLALWRRAPRAMVREAVLFFAGCGVLALSLTGPLEHWSSESLAAHMTQHLLLMAVAAPLLVLGLPPRLLLLPFAMPARRRWLRTLRRASDLRGLAAAQVLVLVFWHLPRALAAALGNETVHLLMHGSFVAVGWLFWSSVLRGGTRGGAGVGGAALLLLVVMTVMALMGAVLTFSPRALYPGYPRLADQQLAGLIMWVPATVPYLAAAVWLGVRWLARAERGWRAGP